ncbi:MAG: hypothetical protein ABI388_10450 [Bacteroidia bacterium]
MSNAIHITKTYKPDEIKKGVYLVLLNANQIPPHIGLLIDNTYHSLTIKGQELNINGNVLLKNISLRKICTVFINLKKHPVFSNNFLNETFIEQVKLFDKVNDSTNTCMSPIRLFMEEFYAIPKENINLIFDLLSALNENDFIDSASATNTSELKENIFYLQTYNQVDLKKQIVKEMKK